MLKILLVLFIIVFSGCAQLGKNSNSPVTFNFSQNGISVTTDILLPASYASAKEKNYPVIYLLDGYWTKDSTEQAYNALRFDNMVPEAIIVSIGYPKHITDFETQRMWDLTPAFDPGFKAGGNADKLLGLLTNQITPFIHNKYRADKNRSLLMGHSLAGLFTLFALYEKPSAFSHYAAISPSALWAKRKLAAIDQDYFQRSNTLAAQLYITYETLEYRPYVSAIEDYLNQLKSRRYKNLNLSLASVKDMGHVSMKAEGYMRALAWAFADIKPAGPSEFENKNIRALKNQN